MKKLLNIVWIFLSFLLMANSYAWDNHASMTAPALEGLKEVEGRKIMVTPLEDFLEDYAKSHPESEGKDLKTWFKDHLKIRKDFEFEAKIGDEPNSIVYAKDVIAAYTDEPDWNMDIEVFHDHPELWKDEYEYMGGKKCTSSQFFRHAYFQAFDWMSPLDTFKMPLSHLDEEMGKAPYRAQTFLSLARIARNYGHPYWQMRFLASAIHYLQDMTNPFHVSQIPTKMFFLKAIGEENMVEAGTKLISYYHFAFEDYLSKILTDDKDTPLKRELTKFLGLKCDNCVLEMPKFKKGRIAQFVKDTAKVSLDSAAVSARTAMDFFPKPPSDQPLYKLNAEAVIDSPEWMESAIAKGKNEPKAKKEYFEIVEEMFFMFGDVTRQVVANELRDDYLAAQAHQKAKKHPTHFVHLPGPIH